jgi:siroheme synthase-like protein
MPTLPIELNLTDRPVLVVGGGRIAARKVAALLGADASVQVVSPHFVPELLKRQDITRDQRPYGPECLAGACLVFACTNDRAVNAAVATDARVRGIWCNVADEPADSDFFLPAVLRQGDLAVSVGTGGQSPRLAAVLRDWLASHLTPEWGILTEELGRARAILRTRVPDAGLRRQILDTLCSDRSIALLTTRDRQAWRHWFEQVTECRLQGLDDRPDLI